MSERKWSETAVCLEEGVGQCSKLYSYFTSSSPYCSHTFVSANTSDLLKLLPLNTNKLPGQQVGEMRNWRAVHDQSIPKKLHVRNLTTKHNPETSLYINLYSVGTPDVRPLDLTKLGDHHSAQRKK